MHGSIHRSVKRLLRLDSSIEDPTPARALLYFSVRRVRLPGYVSPKDRLVHRLTAPDRSRIQTIVEENDERASPVAIDRNRIPPTTGTFHLVCRKVEGVNLSLCEIVPAGGTLMRPRLREARKDFDHVPFPRPRHDSSEVLAILVRGSTRILSRVFNSLFVNPIKKVVYLMTTQFLNCHTAIPLSPLS